MDTKLRPGEDFEEFVESAVTAGECQEGLTFFNHEELSLVHGISDVDVREMRVFQFTRVEESGDDSSHLPPCCQG